MKEEDEDEGEEENEGGLKEEGENEQVEEEEVEGWVKYVVRRNMPHFDEAFLCLVCILFLLRAHHMTSMTLSSHIDHSIIPFINGHSSCMPSPHTHFVPCVVFVCSNL